MNTPRNIAGKQGSGNLFISDVIIAFPPSQAFLVSADDVLNFLMSQLVASLYSLFQGLFSYIIQSTGCWI